MAQYYSFAINKFGDKKEIFTIQFQILRLILSKRQLVMQIGFQGSQSVNHM